MADSAVLLCTELKFRVFKLLIITVEYNARSVPEWKRTLRMTTKTTNIIRYHSIYSHKALKYVTYELKLSVEDEIASSETDSQ